VKPNREDSGHRAVARRRVPAADGASVGRGLDCVYPVQHGRIGEPGKNDFAFAVHCTVRLTIAGRTRPLDDLTQQMMACDKDCAGS
jgi:hypothetical protein